MDCTKRCGDWLRSRLFVMWLGVSIFVVLGGLFGRADSAYGQSQPNARTSPTPAPGRWHPAFGATGRISALLAQGDRLVAYGPTGFILSNDGGQSWRSADNRNVLEVGALALAGDNFLASLREGLVVTDAADLTGVSLRTPQPIYALRFLAYDGALLAGGAGGINVSRDAGVTWSRLWEINPNDAVSALLADQNVLLAGTRSSEARSGVFLSNDQGKTWTQLGGNAPGPENVTGLAANANFLLAGTAAKGVWRVPRGSTQWMQVSTGLPTEAVVRELFSLDRAVFALVGNELYRSLDDGTQWERLAQNFELTTLTADSGRLYLGTTAGAHVSTDLGATWTPLFQGPRGWQLTALSSLGEKLFAASTEGMFVSVDEGRTWRAANAGLNGAGVNCLLAQGDKLYACTATGVFLSGDQAATWTPLGSGLTEAVSALAGSGDKLVAGTAHGVFISDNHGATWIKRSAGLPDAAVSDVLIKGNLLLALTRDSGKVFRSTDQGANWVDSNAGLTPLTNGFPLYVRRLKQVGTKIYAGTNYGAWVSENDGASWTLVDSFDYTNTVTFTQYATVSAIEPRGSSLFFGSPLGTRIKHAPPRHDNKLNDGLAETKNTRLVPAPRAFLFFKNKLFAVTDAGLLVNGPLLNNLSAASYFNALALESIAAAFGSDLAATTQSATQLPLPLTLGGTRVLVKDSAGVERAAPLFFVSPQQVNYLVPAGTAPGSAEITVFNGETMVGREITPLYSFVPGLFSANASGTGVAAAVALRVRADGSQQYEPVARYDAAQKQFVPLPLDLGPATERVYLLLFGTGIRFGSATPLWVRFEWAAGGGTCQYVETAYAGPQGDLAGLDQVNVLLPRRLFGAGEYRLALTKDTNFCANSSGNAVNVSLKFTEP